MARSIFRVTPLFFPKHMFPTCPQNVEAVMTDRFKRGFTLIELLIVIVVIGILAAIAIPKYSSMREKAWIASVTSDLKSLSVQQEIYHGNYESYSASVGLLNLTLSEGVNLVIAEADGRGYAATGWHSALVGRQCGIYYGGASAANGVPATSPGVVQCQN